VPSLRIDIWSDIACPWCYIGKRHLEAALAKFSHAADVEIVWRAFELDPSAPRIRDDGQSYVERLGKKYGSGTAKAEQMLRRVIDTAARDGLDFRFDIIKPGNTFDAHRLVHLAHEHRKQDAMKERFLRAYMTEGQAIGDPAVVATLAEEVGLDPTEVRGVLDSDRFASNVHDDEGLARELGISGVPFFVFNSRLGVSGAQPTEVLLAALDKSWSELAAKMEFAKGTACGPDGCD
jgi:predicted DsbA family dithiol-disulfide isomerase